MLYQAELLSDSLRRTPENRWGGGGGSALITMRPTPRNSSETLVEAAIFPGLRPRRGRVIGVRLLLGRRQVVRHWILIPAFEGSIPSAPASQSVLFMANAKRGNFSRVSGQLGDTKIQQSTKGANLALQNRRLGAPVSGPHFSIS